MIITNLYFTWKSCLGYVFYFWEKSPLSSKREPRDTDHKQGRTCSPSEGMWWIISSIAVVLNSLNNIQNSTMAHMKLDMSYLTEWAEMWQKEDLSSFRSSRCKRSVAPEVDRWARENAHQMPYFVKVITTGSSSNPIRSYSRHPRYRKPRLYRPSMVTESTTLLPGKR